MSGRRCPDCHPMARGAGIPCGVIAIHVLPSNGRAIAAIVVGSAEDCTGGMGVAIPSPVRLGRSGSSCHRRGRRWGAVIGPVALSALMVVSIVAVNSVASASPASQGSSPRHSEQATGSPRRVRFSHDFVYLYDASSTSTSTTLHLPLRQLPLRLRHRPRPRLSRHRRRPLPLPCRPISRVHGPRIRAGRRSGVELHHTDCVHVGEHPELQQQHPAL